MIGRDTPGPDTVIPEREIELFRQQVLSTSEYDDPAWIIEEYSTRGLTVLPSPFDTRVAALIIGALREGAPLSVIRIGDGEVNLVAHGAYVGTPVLDRHAFAATISRMKDSFQINELWMTVLRDLFLLAICQADVVGVRGFSKFRGTLSVRPRRLSILRRLSHDIRGAVGGWRSIDLMVRFAQQDFLSEKSIASAHLYFSVLENLDDVVASASTIICITSRREVTDALREKFPESEIKHIAVGQEGGSGRDGASMSMLPEFLLDVEDRLPEEMQGCLCLVGAGIWSEIYCTWIRRRGGVGVDIGSGFDLLGGEVTRPVHHAALGTTPNPFAVV